MAQFVSFVGSVMYQKEVVSAVSYPMLLIPVLTRSSTLIFMSLLAIQLVYIAVYTSI
jgi:hypothetical protein